MLRVRPQPNRAPRRIRRLAAAVLAALGTFAAGFASAAEPPRNVIKDPHYGDSLFYFFQERYFTSVTNLMASQQFERMPNHADEAEILRGGMFLSYGLHREAGAIFAQLIERGAPPSVRDRAWFYLAKIRYQRGLLAEAEDAIGRIENHLPAALDEERGLLRANLLMARGDYGAAAEALKGMKGAGSFYTRYNLGVALIKSGDVAGGTALLDELGRAPAANEESRSLRDKANVAIGFAALQENNPERARSFLERVRLNGMHSNKALLGFGWAAASLNQPKVALVPWIELAQREASDAAVLEAKLAVPFALGEVGAYGQALNLYEDAIATFEREAVNLDETVAAIRQGKLLEGLLAQNPGGEMGWFWTFEKLPELPHAGHLTQLLAQHEFQEGFKNYRDLLFLETNLRNWKDNLGVYDDMLANRRQAYAERLPSVATDERAQRIAGFEQQRAQLAAEVERAEREGNVEALADEKEREQAARLAGMRAILERGRADPEIAALRERYRRVAGALMWQQTEQFPNRQWQARRGLKDIDYLLGVARGRDAALAQAQRDEPARFDAFAARIVELGRNIDAMLPRVTELARLQGEQVQELAVAQLQRQKERLAVYANQARFAVAQIQDRAYLAKDAGNAAAQ